MAALAQNYLRFFLLAVVLLALTGGAVAAPGDETSGRSDGVEVIKNNQLPLLDNRFRIDHNVKEITLLFFRDRGTAPVILVKPDGSKMYASMALTGEAQWFDEMTYDLIKIVDPMPGPWQAVGRLSPGSKVLIITDFELNVDDLPEVLLQGETIKLTGRVTNNGEPIKAKNFKDVIQLDVDFVSTNNNEYRNFGAGVEQVTSFVDNGKGFDERPKDGVFTGEFNLNFAPGEWIPKYHIQTPLMKRVLEHDPVLVHPNPVKLSIETTDVADEFHKLTIDILGDSVKKETMIFQGKIFYPNQEVQSFSLTEKELGQRTFNVINYDFGLYRITMSAFGETINDRGFMLSIPDFSFAIDPPPVEDAPLDEGQMDEAGNPIADALKAAAEAVEAEPEPIDNTSTYIIIGVANGVLLLLGLILYRVLVQKKSLLPKMPKMFKLPKFSFKRKGKGTEGDEDDENSGKDKKTSDGDDILDLSLPDG